MGHLGRSLRSTEGLCPLHIGKSLSTFWAWNIPQAYVWTWTWWLQRVALFLGSHRKFWRWDLTRGSRSLEDGRWRLYQVPESPPFPCFLVVQSHPPYNGGPTLKPLAKMTPSFSTCLCQLFSYGDVEIAKNGKPVLEKWGSGILVANPGHVEQLKEANE